MATPKRKAESSIASFFTKRPRPESQTPTKVNGPKSPPKTPSSQRKSGFDTKWKTSFTWVSETSDGSGMLCTLCIKHQRRPKKCLPGRAVWVDVPCTSFRRASLTLHKDSDSHKEALVFETSSRETGGIEAGFVREETVNRQALISSMKLLYLLCKEEIPHTTKFQKFIHVAKDLGVDVLSSLEKGGNAKYSSERHVQDLVVLFGRTVWEPIRQDIIRSPFYSVMVDETTDVEVLKELIIYIRYLKEGKSVTNFVRIIDLIDGKAVTIKAAIIKFLCDNDIPLRNMCALGSDGAAVMVGQKGGVGTLLRQDIPHLLSNHCVAHRLALASSQSAGSINYLKRFKRTIEHLYRFYHYSPVRTAALKEIQTILNEPLVKITEAKDVRWLSHDRAAQAVRRCLPSVITSLEREASERDEPQAAGLSSFIQTYAFVATLHMMCDILPVLSALSRAFQTRDGAFTMVNSLVNGTIATLKTLRTHPGQHTRNLPTVVADLVNQPFKFRQPSEREIEQFQTNVYKKFLDAVVENLEKRFPDIPLLEAFSVFNPQQWPECNEELADYGRDSIQVLSDRFETFVDSAEALAEFTLFKNAIQQDPQLMKEGPHRIMEEVAGPLQQTLPNLSKLATVGLLLPTSTADCERGFSTLKRVKTAARNRMSNHILQALLMISMEGPEVLQFDYDSAVDLWAAEKKRRLAV